MRTGYNIELHIYTGQKCLQVGIQHMPDSKAEERWFDIDMRPVKRNY